MKKLKVLETNAAFMMPLGLYSRHLTSGKNEVFTSFAAYFITFCMLSVPIATWLYIRKNWSTDVKSSFGAIKITSGGMQCLGLFVSVGLKLNQVKKLHLKLQEIVDESMHFSIFLFPLIHYILMSIFKFVF